MNGTCWAVGSWAAASWRNGTWADLGTVTIAGGDIQSGEQKTGIWMGIPSIGTGV